MILLEYLGVAYLIAINIATFAIYMVDGIAPERRIKGWLMLLLSFVGGSLGACFGNYFFNTNYRHLTSSYWALLRYCPGFFLLAELFAFAYWWYDGTVVNVLLEYVSEKVGILGYYLLAINCIAFLLILEKSSEYHWLSINEDGIPLKFIIIFIIAGGALGALAAKILFNYKYYNPTDCTKRLENFMYGLGTYIFAVLQIGIILYFFYEIDVIALIVETFNSAN